MSLPFLRKKQTAAVIVKQRGPEGSFAEQNIKAAENEHNMESDKDNDGLLACAHELIEAVGAKDAAGVERALRSAFAILEASEHEESSEEEIE